MPLSYTVIRRLFIAACTTIVITTVVWWALWSIAAGQYRRVIDGWIEQNRAEGYRITYDSRELSGFPRHVTLRFTNVNWRSNTNIGFHADDIDISAIPWQWENYEATFKNNVQIDVPTDESGIALVLGGEDGHAHVKLDKAGIWKFSDVSLRNAKIGRAPGYLFTAEELEATAERPEHPPQDTKEPGLKLSGEATKVALPDSMPTPFGNTMEKVSAEIRVMGNVPDFRRRESVEAWNQNFGMVQFERLHMEWGPLTITAKGSMNFDDDLQPEGAFSSALANHEKVFKALMEHDFIPKRQEAMLSSALSLFAKPAEDAEGIELPIAIQLGGLFLGPVTIFTFPQIEWPAAPPPVPATDAAPEPTPAPTAPTPMPVPVPAPVTPVTPAQ